MLSFASNIIMNINKKTLIIITTVKNALNDS